MQQFVRIIGGRFRGKKLAVADVPGLRPTSDRIRETVFNWLMHDIRGARCLDLFAGSGALGFEACSRGASQVVLIEQSTPAFSKLSQAAAQLNTENLHLIQSDALSWLQQCRQRFDIVFIDPPFASTLAEQALKLIDEYQILVPGGLLYRESNQIQTASTPHWQMIKAKKAGQVHYGLWQYSPSNESKRHE